MTEYISAYLAAVIILERGNETVLETDRGSTSEVSVCVTLGNFSDTLERNVILVLNTVDETATGMTCKCLTVFTLIIIR